MINEKSVVLVVDDSSEQLLYVSAILKGAGYATVTTSSDECAVGIAANLKPDVILLDYQMPHVNGLEICEQLSQREDTKLIPIILCTGDDREELRLEAYHKGAVDFSPKSGKPEELLEKVRMCSLIGGLSIALMNWEPEKTLEVVRNLGERRAEKRT